MADNTPNKKDIQDAKAALDSYNDKLKESINLTKIISDNIASLAGGMNKVGAKGRTIVSDLNDYSKALNKTINLSEKLASGKLKEKEVTDQISSLQAKYNKYLEDSNKRGSYIKENLKVQKALQKEVVDKEQEVLKRRNAITQQYEKFAQQQENLAQATEKYNNANNIQEKQRAAQRIKNIRAEIKDTDITLNVLEKQQSIEEKILTSKKQELDKVESITKAHKDLKKQYEKELKDNEAILAALKQQNSLTGAVSKIYDNLKTKIGDTLKPLALITAAFDFLKKLAFGVSDQTTKLQKNLVLSKEEAYDLRQSFNDLAVSTGDAAINTTRLVEANIALGKQLGFSSKFTADLNVQFIKLTKQIGLSEEAAGGLAKLSIATGATLEESKNIALETSQALSSQFGIQLNQREVLEEVGKISGQTLAMLKASPQAIAQAVAQAKLLGTSLDTVRKQASSLLDFETSISNELQAELLTGRELNLERARTAALTGDLTTAMKELNNQNIDFNKFSQMNVIAQDKVAAALGLSSDELSDQLLKQQYLGKSVEEVAALEGEEVAKRLEALNAQDKFNLAVEKMQDLIGQVVGGPLGKLVDMMASVASSSAFIYGTLTAMAGISLVKLISSLVSVAATLSASAIAGTATASALTFGLAAAGIVAGIGVVAAAIGALTADAQSQVQEAGDMFSSKGKTVVSTKEGGLFSLSENDDLAVAPGIGDMISNANKQTVIAQDNTEMLSKFDALIARVDKMTSGIDGLNRKDITVKANTQTIGTAQLMGNTNLA